MEFSKLDSSQIKWLQKLQRERPAGRKVMWLTHHPYFSTNFKRQVNTVFRKQLEDAKILLPDAWIWGDEHELLIYGPNQFGVGRAVCNGCGAMPELFIENKVGSIPDCLIPLEKRPTSNTYARGFMMLNIDAQGVEADYYQVDGVRALEQEEKQEQERQEQAGPTWSRSRPF